MMWFGHQEFGELFASMRLARSVGIKRYQLFLADQWGRLHGLAGAIADTRRVRQVVAAQVQWCNTSCRWHCRWAPLASLRLALQESSCGWCAHKLIDVEQDILAILLLLLLLALGGTSHLRGFLVSLAERPLERRCLLCDVRDERLSQLVALWGSYYGRPCCRLGGDWVPLGPRRQHDLLGQERRLLLGHWSRWLEDHARSVKLLRRQLLHPCTGWLLKEQGTDSCRRMALLLVLRLLLRLAVGQEWPLDVYGWRSSGCTSIGRCTRGQVAVLGRVGLFILGRVADTADLFLAKCGRFRDWRGRLLPGAVDRNLLAYLFTGLDKGCLMHEFRITALLYDRCVLRLRECGCNQLLV